MEELKYKYPKLRKFYELSFFKNLLLELEKRKKIKYYEISNFSNEIISTLFLVDNLDQHILLLSSRDTTQQYKGSFAYLINEYIKDHTEKKHYLDFEGSNIPSIAQFNESFGAEKHYYYYYTNLKFYQKIKKKLIIITKIFK